jgi:hypothetical protein
VIAVSQEELMRKLIATLAAALALAGIGLTAHTATLATIAPPFDSFIFTPNFGV